MEVTGDTLSGQTDYDDSREAAINSDIADSPEDESSKKLKRNADALIEWIDEHPFNPYPTKTEKMMLAEQAGMTIRQLNDWFANARRNIKKYSYETWKKRKSGESREFVQQSVL